MHALIFAAILAAVSPHRMSLPRPFEGSTFTTAQSWSCSPRRTCKQIATCDEAHWYLQNCSWGEKLDADHDGIPCEIICAR